MIFGLGNPSAMHVNETVSPTITVRSTGCTLIIGATESKYIEKFLCIVVVKPTIYKYGGGAAITS